MSVPDESVLKPDHASEVARALRDAHPEFDEVPELEVDESIPPRPEEEIADASRQGGSV